MPNIVAPVIEIPINSYLRSSEPRLSVDDFREMHKLYREAYLDPQYASQHDALSGIATLDETYIRNVYEKYGEEGLSKLAAFAARTTDRKLREHFLEIISGEFICDALRNQAAVPLRFDTKLRVRYPFNLDVNSHIMVPSLSRKLYAPGQHPGHVVYGIGGPRMLVSHPFLGSNGRMYDVHGNGTDIVTSLMLGGYAGLFLFLDEARSEDEMIANTPRWLLWFSLLSAQSDLVVFIEYGDQGLTGPQVRELRAVPDRVNVVVVDFPEGKFRWAEKWEFGEDTDVIVVGDGQGISEAARDQRVTDYRDQFLRTYASKRPPVEQLVLWDIEQGTWTSLAAETDVYSPPPEV